MVVVPLVALRSPPAEGMSRSRLGAGRGAGVSAPSGLRHGVLILTVAPDEPVISDDGSDGETVDAAAVGDPVVATLPTSVPRSSRAHAAHFVGRSRSSSGRTTGPGDPYSTRNTGTVAASGHSQVGQASWYGAPDGTCAHESLPFGTVVQVTNLANGRHATCHVADRGPYQGGRVIDLSEGVFEQLAPLAEGVIGVRLTW